MTETTKVIFSVIGTGIAVLTVSLTVTLSLSNSLREDMREIRGLLITHITSTHHSHLPEANPVAINSSPELPELPDEARLRTE